MRKVLSFLVLLAITSLPGCSDPSDTVAPGSAEPVDDDPSVSDPAAGGTAPENGPDGADSTADPAVP